MKRVKLIKARAIAFILEKTMKTQEYYIKLDYTTGALVKPSPSARVEGDPASLGVGLIVGDPEADGHGGYRVDVKWMGTQRQYVWKMYVEDLTIISPAGDLK
jgi:hypothetical protein